MPCTALPAKLIFQEANLVASASRADNTVLPLSPTGNKVTQAVFWIREIYDCFLKCLGAVGFHELSMRQETGLVKYIFTL